MTDVPITYCPPGKPIGYNEPEGILQLLGATGLTSANYDKPSEFNAYTEDLKKTRSEEYRDNYTATKRGMGYSRAPIGGGTTDRGGKRRRAV